MRFTKPITTWEGMKKLYKNKFNWKPKGFYPKLIQQQGACGKFLFEKNWYNEGSPYYKVYPSVIPMLTRIDIDNIPSSKLLIPHGLNTLSLWLPESEHSLLPIRSINLHQEWYRGNHVIGMFIEKGETYKQDASSRLTFIPFIPSEEKTVGDVLRGDFGIFENDFPEDYTELVRNYGKDPVECAAKLLCTLCLLGDSPELIQPEVLNADEHKLQGQHNIEALVAKARRRGKYGFTIGKDIEVMPHYRRPHLALVWYGPGKKKSKIIPRKGSIVHRSKVEKIPTGYGMEE